MAIHHVDISLAADEGTGREFSLSLKLWVHPAEPDVGFSSAFVEDWDITGFHKYFSKPHIDKFNRWLDKRPELRKALDEYIGEMELD